MNSEELEQSLRTEFETYLKDVLAEMKQGVSDFQEKIDSEFEKHKTQLADLSQKFSDNFGKEIEIDESFTESVVEHLKLARDEGATITAAAFEEAEELREESEAPTNFSDIRDSINEISAKDTQSDILKSLVHEASQYTPRGAFFIVKSEHLVGWKMFGTEEHPDPEAIRKVYFPISSKTTLSESLETLATISSSYGTHEEDSVFIDKAGFGEPERMYAIPLVVRGRGVAVLYADSGSSEGSVNIEAIESLMRVAGLTVEVFASTPAVADSKEADVPEVDYVDVSEVKSVDSESEYSDGDSTFPPAEADSQYEYDDTSGNIPVESPTQDFSTETSFESADSSYTAVKTEVEEPEPLVGEEPVSTADESVEHPVSEFDETPQAESSEFAVESESTDFESSEFDLSSTPEAENLQQSEDILAPPHVEEEVVVSAPARSRFGDRNVDLPIEVAEDERRYHNDARRFARLLVSEIKLYNEQKVKEGRESSDLYERLREAIDRSREMYDKRVQPPVASKFDYFNYELVFTLAEGDEARLGGSYPGASI